MRSGVGQGPMGGRAAGEDAMAGALLALLLAVVTWVLPGVPAAGADVPGTIDGSTPQSTAAQRIARVSVVGRTKDDRPATVETKQAPAVPSAAIEQGPHGGAARMATQADTSDG